jgi:hypothetical protein
VTQAEPPLIRGGRQPLAKQLTKILCRVSECAGINRHVVGDERALQERRTANPSLASSLAGSIARWALKRRQRYQWAGLLSFENPMEQDADSIPRGGRQYGSRVKREWLLGPA